MAKKNFKSGLDILLSSTGMEKTEEKEDDFQDIKKLDDNQKHWLLIKNDRLNKELHYWRTGKLTPETFTESLKKNKLQYNSETNEIY